MKRSAAILVAILTAACAAPSVRREARTPVFFGIFTDEEAQREDVLRAEPGLLVLEVFQDSPAAVAGIVPGDALLQIGDRDIRTTRDLDKALADAAVGDRLRIVLARGRGTVEKEVILVPRQPMTKAVQPRDRGTLPRTILVSEDGGLHTLSAAMYEARRGDTIDIRAGEYGVLHLMRDGVKIKGAPDAVVEAVDGTQFPRDVTITGLRVRPSSGSKSPYPVVIFQAANIALHGVEISGGTSALYVSGSRGVKVWRSRISGSTGAAARIAQSREVELVESTFFDSGSGVDASQTEIKLARDFVVQNRRYVGTPEKPSFGVKFSKSEGSIDQTTIADNSGGGPSAGVWVEGEQPVTIAHSVISGQSEAVRLSAGAKPDLVGDDTTGRLTFRDTEAGDYTVGPPRVSTAAKQTPPGPAQPKRKVKVN
jgi:hypothetical protein